MTTTTPPRSLLDRTERNRDASTYLVVPHVVLTVLVVGLIVGLSTVWWLGVVAALLSGVLVAVLLPKIATSNLGSLLESRPAPEPEFPRYHNLIEGLSMSSGTVVPELRVLDEPGLNLAVYGPPDEGTIVATSGLLDALDRVELEGVLAAALVRLRSHDAELGAAAVGLVCGPLAKCGPRTGGASGYAAMGAARRAERLRSVLGDQRCFLGDLGAVDMTRYPPGLGAALEKMERSGTGVASATWGTAHLWLADPLMDPPGDDDTARHLNELFGADAPIDQRASLMAEL